MKKTELYQIVNATQWLHNQLRIVSEKKEDADDEIRFNEERKNTAEKEDKRAQEKGKSKKHKPRLAW